MQLSTNAYRQTSLVYGFGGVPLCQSAFQDAHLFPLTIDISATPTFRHNTKSIISDLNLFSMLSSETANMSHPPTCHTSCPLCILSQDKKFPHRTQPRGSQGKKGGREVFGAKSGRFRGCVVGLETRHPLVPITDRNAAWNIHESGAGRNKTNISGFACKTGADEELLK